MEWVTKTTEAPVSPAIRSSSVCMRSRVISSSAPKARPSAAAGLLGQRAGDGHPLLHAPGELVRVMVAEVLQGHHLQQLLDLALRWAVPTPCSCSGSAMFSATVRQGSRPAFWNAMP